VPASSFIKRVERAVGLSESDREALRRLRVVERNLRPREPVIREGDIATQCTLLLEGFLARVKFAGDGEQILSIHVPGDFPDLQTLHLPLMDHDLISIGTSRIGMISHEHMEEILSPSQSLTHIFWRETLVDAAIFREWVCNVAAREALAGIAHLICELAARLDAVGLVKDDSFQLPLTQQDLANAFGLSVVHVNRTMQDLRKRKLFTGEGKTVTLLNRTALEQLAEFTSDYLQQVRSPGKKR
jgi:CRP-like cAMP-binding protein